MINILNQIIHASTNPIDDLMIHSEPVPKC